MRSRALLCSFVGFVLGCGGSVGAEASVVDTGAETTTADASTAADGATAPPPAPRCGDVPTLLTSDVGPSGVNGLTLDHLRRFGDSLYWLSSARGSGWLSSETVHRLSRTIDEHTRLAEPGALEIIDFRVVGAQLYGMGVVESTSSARGGLFVGRLDALVDSAVVLEEATTPHALASEDGSVFWWSAGMLRRHEGSGTAVVDLAPSGYVSDLLAADGVLYRAEARAEDRHTFALVRTPQMPSTPADAIVVTANMGQGVRLLGVDETHVYWQQQDGGISRSRKTGGPPEVVMADFPTDLDWAYAVLDGHAVYVAHGGVLRRIATSDGAETVLATMKWTDEVAVDDRCVYWFGPGGLWMRTK